MPPQNTDCSHLQLGLSGSFRGRLRSTKAKIQTTNTGQAKGKVIIYKYKNILYSSVRQKKEKKHRFLDGSTIILLKYDWNNFNCVCIITTDANKDTSWNAEYDWYNICFKKISEQDKKSGRRVIWDYCSVVEVYSELECYIPPFRAKYLYKYCQLWTFLLLLLIQF